MDPISPKFLALAQSSLSVNPVICDIGSRDAEEGIWLFHYLSAKELHVFEPNPTAAQRCRHRIEKAGKSGIRLNEVAVMDKRGEVKFFPVNPDLSQNKDIGFSSVLRINPEYTRRRGHIVQDEITVETTTLDHYFRDRQPPELLWIDVEGAEILALRGAQNTLRHVRIIHIEVSFRAMQIGRPLFWEIERFLEEHNLSFRGFVEVSDFRGLLYRHKLLPNPPWRLNAIFCRS